MRKMIIILLVMITMGVGFWLVYKNVSSKDINIIKDLKPSSIKDNVNQLGTNQNQIKNVPQFERGTIINNKIKIMTATIHTNKGDILIEFNQDTPKTVENFINLAKSGFYDGTKFHRVIKGFMSQGGDPLTKDDSKKDFWGTGGPGYKFNDEITSSNKNNINTISMANSGPNTNGSQFFINAADNNYLDTKHTVFGKLISGMDVALVINSVPTDEYDRPIDPIIIQSISLK